MSDLHELERAILSARDTGNVTRMRELQDVYRSSATVTRITREPVHVIDGLAGAASVVGAAVAAPARVSRSSAAATIPRRLVLTGFGWETIRDADWGNDVELGAWLLGRVEGDELVVYQTGGWVVGESNSVRLSGDAARSRITSAAPAGSWSATCTVTRAVSGSSPRLATGPSTPIYRSG